MRVLIVRLSAMGDIIHSLPLAENARRAGVEVGWLVESAYAGLLEGNPSVARVFSAPTKRWRRQPFQAESVRGIRALARNLREFAPDVAVDAQGLWKSALLAGLVKAPIVGFAGRDRRESSSSALIDRPVRITKEAVHVVDQNLLLLGPLGIPVVTRAPDARYLLAQPRPEAEAFLKDRRIRFAIYHPGSARAKKTWGEEQFAELARRLREERGLSSVISWGPGDESRAERLASLLPDSAALPPLDLPGLAHVIERCTIFIAGDTGPVHMADALGKPALALFGPRAGPRNVPGRNRPYRGWFVRVDDEGGVESVLEQAKKILDGRPGDRLDDGWKRNEGS
jgi:heptosyltransferase-1